MNKDDMTDLLIEWGRWQRTAKHPNLREVISQHETPLKKERNVKPIFKNSLAEQLDSIIAQYLPGDYKTVLILTYVDQTINAVAADMLKCSVKTYMIKRGEAIAMLVGIYRVLKEPERKIAQC